MRYCEVLKRCAAPQLETSPQARMHMQACLAASQRAALRNAAACAGGKNMSPYAAKRSAYITDNREALCGFSVCLTHGSHTFGSPRSPASSRLPETRRAGWQGRTTGSAVSRLTPFPRQELPKSLSLLRTPPASAAVLGLQGTTACGFPACEPHVRRIGSPPCVSIVRNARGAGKAQKHLPESCA